MSAVTHVPGFASVSVRRPAAAGERRKQSRQATAAAPLRLTSRGQVVALAAVFLVALAVLSVGSRAFAAADVEGHDVRVRAGQTLSQVAHEALPDLPVAEAVSRVQLANDLNSDQVDVGQVLHIPG